MASTLCVTLMVLCVGTASFATQVTVNPSDVAHTVDEHFLSFTVDSGFFGKPDRWQNFDYTSIKLQNLMSSLGPAILRIGGTAADYTYFDASNNVTILSGLLQDIQIMTTDDWDRFNWLVRGCGLRLLYDLNMQTRFGSQWNPMNAISLMEYTVAMNYADNVDFELGNEPDHGDRPDKEYIDPEQFAFDYSILHSIMKQYPQFRDSRLVGPDVTNADPITEDNGKILANLAEHAGSFMDALTVHHYYFDGEKASVQNYLDPKHFHSLSDHIQYGKDIIQNSSNPDLPLWLGETADAYHGGTQNVSDRFVSGFLWLDKLGVSAAMDVKVVMRQTLYGGNYALLDANMDPNPDYWLSLLYKKIVGQEVLKVQSTSAPNTTRVYAHMTNRKDCEGISDCYPEGSVTVYALNMNPKVGDKISIEGALADMMMDTYLVTAGDQSGPLSKIVNLNGTPLKLIGDDVPQTFVPKTGQAKDGIDLPPLSYGYFVFYKG